MNHKGTEAQRKKEKGKRMKKKDEGWLVTDFQETSLNTTVGTRNWYKSI
jgi:hypothetical protein